MTMTVTERSRAKTNSVPGQGEPDGQGDRPGPDGDEGEEGPAAVEEDAGGQHEEEVYVPGEGHGLAEADDGLQHGRKRHHREGQQEADEEAVLEVVHHLGVMPLMVPVVVGVVPAMAAVPVVLMSL